MTQSPPPDAPPDPPEGHPPPAPPAQTKAENPADPGLFPPRPAAPLVPSPSGFGEGAAGRQPTLIAPLGGNPGGWTPSRGKRETVAIVGYLLLSLLLFTSIPAFISNAPGYGLLFGIIVCPLMIFVGRLLFRVRLARPVASGGESEPRSTLDTIGVILVYVFVAFMIVLGLMLAALVIFLIICTINPPRF